MSNQIRLVKMFMRLVERFVILVYHSGKNWSVQ